MLIELQEINRFWSKVDIREPNECWEWTKGCYGGGYGRFRCRSPRLQRPSHIIALELSLGRPLGSKMCALHRCDNRPCCNPAHLWEGTHQDNMADMVQKGRSLSPVQTGDLNHNATLTDNDIPIIRQMIMNGQTNTSIAAKYGVTHSMISRIKLRKSWAHIREMERPNGLEPMS